MTRSDLDDGKISKELGFPTEGQKALSLLQTHPRIVIVVPPLKLKKGE